MKQFEADELLAISRALEVPIAAWFQPMDGEAVIVGDKELSHEELASVLFGEGDDGDQPLISLLRSSVGHLGAARRVLNLLVPILEQLDQPRLSDAGDRTDHENGTDRDQSTPIDRKRHQVSRRALIRKRCTSCGATVTEKACPKGHRRWTWSFTVDINPPGAPRRQLTRSGFDTRAAAQRSLDELKGAVSRDQYVEPDRRSLERFCRDNWLPVVRRSLRPSTFCSYEDQLRAHVFPAIGSIPLQGLEPNHLDELYGKLLNSGRLNGTGGLSPRTVRYIHTIIGKALKDAVRWGLVVRNVADLATPPRPRDTRAPEMVFWTPQEVARFLEATRSDREHPVWVLALTTGMRRGEVVGIRWRDVDLEAGRLHVKSTLVSVRYRVIESDPKTEKSRRPIALDQKTIAVLREWRVRQLEERLLCGEGWVDNGLVFTRPDGSGLHPDRVSKLFDLAVARAGVPRIRFHDVRHTWATTALRAGVHPKIVSERLGHSSIQVTLDIYSHVSEEQDREAATKVADLFRQ